MMLAVGTYFMSDATGPQSHAIQLMTILDNHELKQYNLDLFP